jgi:hypothetical protein
MHRESNRSNINSNHWINAQQTRTTNARMNARTHPADVQVVHEEVEVLERSVLLERLRQCLSAHDVNAVAREPDGAQRRVALQHLGDVADACTVLTGKETETTAETEEK